MSANQRLENQKPARRRSVAFHLGRGAAWVIGGVLALVVAVVLGFSWYSTTGDFQRRVGREIVSVLEDATGGRSLTLQGDGSGGKQVAFATQIGRMAIKTKFTFKEMMYHDSLAI